MNLPLTLNFVQTADQFEFSIRSIEYLHNDHLKRLALTRQPDSPAESEPVDDTGDNLVPSGFVQSTNDQPVNQEFENFENPQNPQKDVSSRDRSPSPPQKPIRIEEGPLNALISPS